MSVPTVDEDAWRTLEPGTAHPLQRLRAVRELVDAGINAGVLMAPIVPGFSSSRSKLERTIKAIADHGARFVGCNVMYLQDGTRTHFMDFIEREFPAMRAAVRKAVREEVSAGCLSQGGAGDGARAAGALRPGARREDAGPHAARGARRSDSIRRSRAGRVRLVDCARSSADVARSVPIESRVRSLHSVHDELDRRVATTSKCEPSFHRALIGSLMRSSMTRFRNRAPNARL